MIPQREIRVGSCRTCPFFYDDGEYPPVCLLAGFEDDDCGGRSVWGPLARRDLRGPAVQKARDDLEQRRPDWCPLRVARYSIVELQAAPT